jgi:hypothetical protein
MILFIVLTIAYVVELSYDYGVVLEKRYAKNIRKKYCIRLILATLIMYFTALWLVTKFGVTSYNLGDFLRHGIVR